MKLIRGKDFYGLFLHIDYAVSFSIMPIIPLYIGVKREMNKQIQSEIKINLNDGTN